MPTFALSTSWCSHRHNDGYAMLQEMAELGFSHVELSHGIRIVLVPGILRAVEEHVVKIASTHNFCPLPTGVNQAAPNLFEPSSGNSKERDQWLKQTRRSLDFAMQVRARALVCHLGSVTSFWGDPAAKLNDYLEGAPQSAAATDPRLRTLVEKTISRLRSRGGVFWERVLENLREIDAYARQKGVSLGLENRERVEELPFDDGFDPLFAALGAGTMGRYWHDTGHAAIKDRLGLIQHRALLEKNAHRALGFHVHDLSADLEDHQPIGSGTVDFQMVSSFWKPEHIVVLELSPSVSVDSMLESKRRIESLFRT